MGLKDGLLLLLNLLAARRNGDHDPSKWDYQNTTSWVTDYPSCGGMRQSPINLESDKVAGGVPAPLHFENYNLAFMEDIEIENNGHSAEISLPETLGGTRPKISGGLLNGEYEAHSIHFHWGSLLKKGSEHAINGRHYDAELHIVHKNVKYATGAEASENPDGIAVVSILVEIVDNPLKYYSGLRPVFKKVPKIKNPETNTTITKDLTLDKFLGEIDTNKFFAYEGSLTTPPCSEAVTWHVLMEPLQISRLRLYNLFTLKHKNGANILDNHRPLQDLNDRLIYA